LTQREWQACWRRRRALVAELDPQAVLDRILSTAREVTGARYAALGILDERRASLEQFITLASTSRRARRSASCHAVAASRRAESASLVRCLSDVSRHPQSYGFPDVIRR